MTPDLWSRRRARAVQLLGEAPHAEELLAFYVGLVEAQARVAASARPDRWLARIRPDGSDGPRMRLDRVPWDDLDADFCSFVESVRGAGTTVIGEAGRTVLAWDADERKELLFGYVRAQPAAAVEGAGVANSEADRDPGGASGGALVERPAVASGAPDASVTLFARAFVEPVAWGLRRALRAADEDGARIHEATEVRAAPGAVRVCPWCFGLPQVSVLRDEPAGLGRRSLVCGTCAGEWPYPRLTCASCGETDASLLAVHQPDAPQHVRLDECRACGRYLKSVDLRKRGGAEPVVDELGTVELDLWAGERGLVKVRRNVLGL